MIRPAVVLPLLAALGINAAHVSAQPRGAATVATACCSITAIDAQSGVVSAKVTASGLVFEFKAKTAATLAALRLGQTVQVNFTNNQVSLDGRTVCCTVTKAPAPAVAARPPVSAPPTKTGGNVAPVAGGALQTANRAAAPPTISFGDPIPHNANSKRLAEINATAIPAVRYQSRTLAASLGSRQLAPKPVLHLYGLDGIENAPSSLPDGVRRLLEIHARKTGPGEQTHYIVDPQIARDWIKDHPVPPEVKVKSGGGKCRGSEFERFRCRTEKSWDNLSDLTSEEWEQLRKKAQDWWDDGTKLIQQCTSANGWKDHVMTGPTAPVKFKHTAQWTIDMEKSASKGAAKGSIKGTVGLAFPIDADIQTTVTLFYIPCLPGVYRFRSLTADGSLTVGNQLTLGVTAQGSFDKRFTIPPTGGPQIPLYVIPIVIGEVPVAVIDVSAYVEGDVRVFGTGSATGQVGVANSHKSTFNVDCSGQGCKGPMPVATSPTTTNQSAQIAGQVSVQPGIYTALQLSFDYNVLQGRVGPEPYLLGVANGCGAVSATQTAGTSTTQTNSLLAADLDWGALVRAEALVAGQKVGEPWEKSVMKERHLWFKDIAPGGSTALIPAVTGPAQGVAAQSVPVKVRMPSCYPYTEKVEYRISWDGGATPAPNAACDWQRRTCSYDPTKDLTLNLVWPNAGAYTVSITLVSDNHRTFSPTPAPARFGVTVGAAASGGQP